MTLGTANANQVKLDSNTLPPTKDFIQMQSKSKFPPGNYSIGAFYCCIAWQQRGNGCWVVSPPAHPERGTIWRWELGPGDHPRRDQHQLTAFSPVVALKHVVANHMTLMSKSERFFGLFIFRNDNQAKRVQVK